jgi:hypothetical protein
MYFLAAAILIEGGHLLPFALAIRKNLGDDALQ